MNVRYKTADVAHKAEIHKDTLLRWLRKGLIREPKRDRHGWRIFTEQEMLKVIAFARAESIATKVGEQSACYEMLTETGRLKAIDWDFRDVKTIYLTHGQHPYPAKFIPQIPNALIQELSSIGETVLDIFCGSGTTLVEALLLKRHAIGIDANPLACLISQCKTSQVSEKDIELLNGLVERANELADTLYTYRGTLFNQSTFSSRAWRPADPAITFWFEQFVLEELAEILSWCRSLSTHSSRQLALTTFSSIIVAVSRQDSDTRYVRRQKDIKPGDTARRFTKALMDAIHAAQEFSELVESRFHCSVFYENILNGPEIGHAHLVVCSPPYPNAYSYHLYHMTRMLWLGMDQPRFKKEEIGSHRKYSKKNNGATEDTFRKEMSSIFNWLGGVLERGRYACFVIGNSCINGRNVNNADLISDVAKRHGFSEVERIPRRMQDSRKSFNPAHGRIKTEQILILQNWSRN